jgi:hypothetical protein
MSNGTIRLRSGREVNVTSLRQGAVYAGLIEGVPTKQMNRHEIEGILAGLRRSGSEPYLIAPQERPITLSRPYPFGEPAALPGISCVARLRSDSPARGGGDHSYLTVVWFQDDYAFPIDKTVLDQIVCLDWEKLAFDYEL